MTGQANLVEIIGGLGNQLFQYAFGQWLEQQTGLPTRYDLRRLAGYRTHAGGLAIEQVFTASICEATTADHAALGPLAGSLALRRPLAHLASRVGRASPLQTDRQFRPGQAVPAGARVWAGYWQHPQFATATARNLVFQTDVSDAAARIIADHGLDPARDAAVHVRRGDFLTTPKACHLPLAEETYYAPLMRQMAEQGVRRFLILSDDIAPLRNGPLAQFDCLFAGPGVSPSAGVDLCLLGSFATTIMSASSFSWWGAALNRQPERRILYPSPWVKLRFATDPTLTAAAMPGWTTVDTRPVQAGTGPARLP